MSSSKASPSDILSPVKGSESLFESLFSEFPLPTPLVWCKETSSGFAAEVLSGRGSLVGGGSEDVDLMADSECMAMGALGRLTGTGCLLEALGEGRGEPLYEPEVVDSIEAGRPSGRIALNGLGPYEKVDVLGVWNS